MFQGEQRDDEVQGEAEVSGHSTMESDDCGKNSTAAPVLAKFRFNGSPPLGW